MTLVLKQIIPSALVLIGILACPKMAEANVSYTPWIHSIIQDGPDAIVTINVFEQVTETAHGSLPFPGLEAPYTLSWHGSGESGVLFDKKVFEAVEADEVTEFGCQLWKTLSDMDYSKVCGYEPESCVDCDEDGVPECYGFCGVAYRFQVLNHCPPFETEVFYEISTSADYNSFGSDGSLGEIITSHISEEAEDQCAESEPGCSISHAGNAAKKVNLFQVLIKLVGSA